MKKICPNGHHFTGSRCSECRRPSEAGRERAYDHRWNMLSKRKRAHNPLCEDCEANGRIEPATEVHHIVPVSVNKHLIHEWTNLVSLCGYCHDQRHKDMKNP